MQNISNKCESYFEVALERQARGLPVRDAEELTAHLETCSSCREYSEMIGRMEVIVQAGNKSTETKGTLVRANAYRTRIERALARKAKGQLWVGLPFGLVMLAVGLIDSRDSLAIFGGGWALQALAQVGYQRYRTRKLNALASSSVDLLGAARRGISMRYFLTLAGMFGAFLFALVCFANALKSKPSWLPTVYRDDAITLHFVFGFCFLVVIFHLRTEVLPRIRRERQLFE